MSPVKKAEASGSKAASGDEIKFLLDQVAELRALVVKYEHRNKQRYVHLHKHACPATVISCPKPGVPDYIVDPDTDNDDYEEDEDPAA